VTSRGDDAGVGRPKPPRVDPGAPLPPELDPRRGARVAAPTATASRPQQAEKDSGNQPRSSDASSPKKQSNAGKSTKNGGEIRRGLRLGGSAVAVLLALAVLVASGWAWWTWHGFTSDLKRVDAVGGAAKPAQDIDGKDQNILIVGNDDRDTATDAELTELGTTRDGGSLNTDTMMVMHIPANGRKATVIAIPRDSYVSIPGHGMNKINAAYALGTGGANGNKAAGAQLAVQTVEQLTGLTIDHFVQVDLIGFYRISNAIGGVQVNLCAPAKEANSGIDLPAGVSTIKGKQALAFVRQRYGFPDGLGDLDRIHRQQYFLSAVFRKLSSAGVLLNPFKLQDLLKAVSTSLSMDKTLDPLKLAEQMQNLSAGNLIFTTIPTDGFATEDVGSVVVVHPSQVQQRVVALVAQTNSTTSSAAAPKTVAPSSVTVDVLNGAAASGVAATNAAALRQLGFQIGTVGNAATIAATVVKYPSGQQAQAATVAAHIPGATTQASTDVKRVTLVIGEDGRSVTTGGAAAANQSGGTSARSSTTPGVTSAAQNASGCIY
jgi:LCP family protein required for cell wall assembly